MRPDPAGAASPSDDALVGEGFMTAGELRSMARRAGIAPGDSVLDLCCGVGGPGRLVTAETGCDYLGVDRDPVAVAAARRGAGELPCRYAEAQVPPLPRGPFDAVLLLETLLAFPDKEPLLAAVAGALRPGGRFAFTVEEGRPLAPEERAAMPAADTVWPVPLPVLLRALERHGFALCSVEEHTDGHRQAATALADAYAAAREDDLVTSHRLWVDWLGSGRVRKLAVVAVR